MSTNLPTQLNYSNNKPMAAGGKPYINRFRSDNGSYSGGDVIRIEIPTGRNGSYLFPKDSFIEGRVAISATDSTASKSYYIDQSCYSLFNRIRVYHGSNIVEDTLYTNKLWTAIYDFQVNEVERRQDCITKMVNETGTAGNSVFNDGCTGQKVLTTSATANTNSGSYLYDFCFPLPSALLGSLCSKALPLGVMGAASIYLELELSTTAMAFVTDSTTNTSASHTVDSVYYNAKMTTLPNDINDLVIESTGGMINIPAIAYKTEAKTIAAGSTSWNDKFSFQFSSIQNFLFFPMNSSTAAGSIAKRSVSSRPQANISDFFLQINGEAYPSQTIAGQSRMYSELQRAFDTLCDTNSGGIITFQNYNRIVHTAVDDVLPAIATNATNKRFLGGIDLSRFNRTQDCLMAGTSSIGQMLSMQLNFNAATTDSLTLYAAVMYDILFHIEGGLISPKF